MYTEETGKINARTHAVPVGAIASLQGSENARERAGENVPTSIYIQKIQAENERFRALHGVSKKVYVLTFGCQQNEADSEKLTGMAIQMGYEPTKEAETADLILVNTCAIREHAEQKALSLIGQFKHIKEKNPELVIAVCGCMVAQEHRQKDIKFRYPYVNFIFGTAALSQFPRLLAQNIATGKRLYYNETPPAEMTEGLPVHRESNYKAWVSIMYGCNNFCSYCIVPYVRGRERSRRKEPIFEEVQALVQAGYKDITLLGQNVNSYGKDSAFDYDFADLLAWLATIPGDYRLRFMTSHPKDATEKLMNVMAENEHIAKHFHLPMQAGSDRILRLMNRKYDTARYLETVRQIREKMPDCAITSDIIVGFPGETEEDFEGTLSMLRRVRFDMLYSFIFSPRKGTPAASMPDPVPREVQGERFQRLLALQNEIALEKNLPLVGQTVRVLCDGVSKTDASVYSGRTETNKIVFFEGTPADCGQYIYVNVQKAEAFALYGTKV